MSTQFADRIEMQNRLFRRLGGWAMLDEASLRAALLALYAVYACHAIQPPAATAITAMAIPSPLPAEPLS